MADFYETARKIVQELMQVEPGSEKTINISGYLLCQGIVHFIEDVVKEDGTVIDLEQFTFNWDNDDAQRRTNTLLPLTVSRVLSQHTEVL